ncbi:uncharacterized protein Pyn_38459 [Prunus yedoensis var. nudiflora]|uniref:Uncharacterized protein n=1 Tax=Prunus yedoensis var. nudiflora TaxID=2094558 RepID=A0A314YLZ1_PRUYE|nr:uncharacterized protein Pyn_38459 [Prunus yedoensis var. nudiflora]
MLHSCCTGCASLCSAPRQTRSPWSSPTRPITLPRAEAERGGQYCRHRAYFPELRGAVNIADTEPLANAFARAPRKHNATAFCYRFFYGLTERTSTQFRVCLARPFPLFLAHDLSVIPDGETENDLKEIWGSFLVSRDLHCGLSKAGAEVYLPNFVARQFGLIQTAPLPPLSMNRLSS